ncbi:hypothetical protein Tco_1440358 [Tanacetum coccineum]
MTKHERPTLEDLYPKSGVNSRSLCKRKSFGSKTCFVCGSKFHLIKDCDFYEKQLELHNKPLWTNVANIPSFVPKAASVPAGSRNRPSSVPADSRHRTTSVPAGSMNRPTSVPAGSRNRPTSVPAGRKFVCLGFLDFELCVDSLREHSPPFLREDAGLLLRPPADSGCSSKHDRKSRRRLDGLVKIIGRVLFTDKECLVLSKEFQLPENSQVVLRVPRRNNIYCFNLSDIKPERGVTCLLAKASLEESTKWQ